MFLVFEDVGQDSVPDGSTIVPEVQTAQTESTGEVPESETTPFIATLE